MGNGMDDWTDGNEEDVSEGEEEIRKGTYSYNSYFKDIFNVFLVKKMKGKAATVNPSQSLPCLCPACGTVNRLIVSAEQEKDLMPSILGILDNSATNPLPKKFPRKRKSSPVEDSDSESPFASDDAFSSPRAAPSKGHAWTMTVRCRLRSNWQIWTSIIAQKTSTCLWATLTWRIRGSGRRPGLQDLCKEGRRRSSN